MRRIFAFYDDLDLRKVVWLMFQFSGFQCISIDGRNDDLFRTVEEFDPHLIISDVRWTGTIDGFEFCRRLKQSPETRPIPFVFCTDRADANSVVKGMELGAHDYLHFFSLSIHRVDTLNKFRTIIDSCDLEPFFALKRRWYACAESERAATFTPLLNDTALDPVCREYLTAKLAGIGNLSIA